jgi:excisionase family DNA binding protein
MEASANRGINPAGGNVFRLAQSDIPQVARLDQALRAAAGTARRLEIVLSSGEHVTLPDDVRRALALVAREMATGNGVAVVPVHHELTTHEAAAVLHVSRPHLIRMLDEGRLPSRKVGTHRRIRFDDVMAFRARQEEEREALLARVAQESQSLGLEF